MCINKIISLALTQTFKVDSKLGILLKYLLYFWQYVTILENATVLIT